MNRIVTIERNTVTLEVVRTVYSDLAIKYIFTTIEVASVPDRPSCTAERKSFFRMSPDDGAIAATLPTADCARADALS